MRNEHCFLGFELIFLFVCIYSRNIFIFYVSIDVSKLSNATACLDFISFKWNTIFSTSELVCLKCILYYANFNVYFQIPLSVLPIKVDCYTGVFLSIEAGIIFHCLPLQHWLYHLFQFSRFLIHQWRAPSLPPTQVAFWLVLTPKGRHIVMHIQDFSLVLSETENVKS